MATALDPPDEYAAGWVAGFNHALTLVRSQERGMSPQQAALRARASVNAQWDDLRRLRTATGVKRRR